MPQFQAPVPDSGLSEPLVSAEKQAEALPSLPRILWWSERQAVHPTEAQVVGVKVAIQRDY